ncbi:hypothetical protein [Dapis sp. BLCC M229]|uniref:hypothetical protein n=1 Tax=Dapis sp. BLCC M229 TaxID=3400188 RepID=UPI003CF60041
MKMKLKNFLGAAIPVIALIFPIVMTFLITVEPALAQRSDRNLKQNITDVDVDDVLASLL